LDSFKSIIAKLNFGGFMTYKMIMRDGKEILIQSGTPSIHKNAESEIDHVEFREVGKESNKLIALFNAKELSAMILMKEDA
jgi:hypothetical protein